MTEAASQRLRKPVEAPDPQRQKPDKGVPKAIVGEPHDKVIRIPAMEGTGECLTMGDTMQFPTRDETAKGILSKSSEIQ